MSYFDVICGRGTKWYLNRLCRILGNTALWGKNIFAPPLTKTVVFEVEIKRIFFVYNKNKAC